jgi:acyl-CoA thioesterase YciA
METEKKGELAIKVVAMPADTNPSGDIFGGWIISQMDIAGSVFCRKIIKDRVVTIAINSMIFKQPVFIGDTVCCYVNHVKTGNTSMTVHIEAWANRELDDENIKVTEGDFTYVKINNKREPQTI